MGDETCACRRFRPDLHHHDAHRIGRDYRNGRLHWNRCAGVGRFADFLSGNGFAAREDVADEFSTKHSRGAASGFLDFKLGSRDAPLDGNRGEKIVG
jgi:hypothetical protein